MSNVISSVNDNNKPKKVVYSRPVQVAEAIKGFVVENNLRPGDRLPNETELISRFGMAKSTIREATRLLEAQGLIVTRTGPGGGCFVHEVSENRTVALLRNFFYFKKLSISEIYQLRKILEPEVAAELTGKLDPEVAEQLWSILAEYDTFPKSEEEEKNYHQSSLKFHAQLGALSNNGFLSFTIRFMAEMLSEVTIQRRLYDPPNKVLWTEGRKYQERLLDSLKNGTSEESRTIMYEHMCFAEKLILKQEATLERRFSTFS
jgi:GntR family transcriptional repressor for pyruvate dehydrogenase complex